MKYSRREILRAFALGGSFIAGKLWIPGQKLISIPASGGVIKPCASTYLYDAVQACMWNGVYPEFEDGTIHISLHTSAPGLVDEGHSGYHKVPIDFT